MLGHEYNYVDSVPQLVNLCLYIQKTLKISAPQVNNSQRGPFHRIL